MEKDWTGFTNGKIKVIGKDIERYNKDKERVKNGEIKRFNTLWICQCECGNKISLQGGQIPKRTCCNNCKEKTTVAKNLIGKSFGDWTVISRNYERTLQDKKENKFPRVYWNCKCKCGNRGIVSTSHLTGGKSTKCLDCFHKSMQEISYKNIIGMKYGDLTVISMDIEYMKRTSMKRSAWKCQCKCGKIETYKLDSLTSYKNSVMCKECRHKYIGGYGGKGYKTSMITRNKNNIKENGSFLDVLLSRYSLEEVNEFWSEKNLIKPNELTRKSHQNIYIKCPICKEIYQTSPLPLYYKVGDIKCIECGQKEYFSSFELLVKDYINNKLNLETLHEYKCNLLPINPNTNCIMPYDNEIIGHNIIIEVHGKQHYDLLDKNSRWLNGLTPKEFLDNQKWRDNYKKEYAINNGYRYLEISYLDVLNDSFKEKINDILREKV